MVPVSCMWIEIEFPSFSGGEDQNIPRIQRTNDLKNKGVQAGKPHLSRRMSKETLSITMVAAPAVDSQQTVSYIT